MWGILNSYYNYSDRKFLKSFRWNFWGSIFYESLKFSHQILLFKNLILSSYGQVGIIFSVIFLITHLFGFAAEKSLAPFINDFMSSKLTVIRHALPYLLAQCPLLLLGGIAYKFFIAERVAAPQILNIWIPILIIFFEGMRMLLRTLLHNIFIDKPTIITETLSMIFYFSLVWIPYFFFGKNLTIHSIFIPYLLTSIIAVFVFFIILGKHYLSLPITKESTSENLLFRVIKTRFFNYTTEMSQYFFCGNFLVPFFGIKFGFEKAGIFKFASYLADAIKGVIHVVVGFSGGALLASLKTASKKEKLTAFYALNQKVINILLFVFIFLIVNYQTLFSMTCSAFYDSSLILTFVGYFLLFVFSKHIFAAYQQSYIVD